MFETVYPEFTRINDAVMRETRRIAEIGLASCGLLRVIDLANVLEVINPPSAMRSFVSPSPPRSAS